MSSGKQPASKTRKSAGGRRKTVRSTKKKASFKRKTAKKGGKSKGRKK